MVHEAYRGQQLGSRVIMEWHKHTKRPVVLAPITLNPAAGRATLKAHLDICRWALEQGKEVAEPMLQELKDGTEAQWVSDMISEVERTGHPFTIQARSHFG